MARGSSTPTAAPDSGRGPAPGGDPARPDGAVVSSGLGAPAADAPSVKDEYDALVKAVGTVNDVDLGGKDAPILDVSIMGGRVSVQYVDRKNATAFDPDPRAVISAVTE
jgi:hypothetical protein